MIHVIGNTWHIFKTLARKLHHFGRQSTRHPTPPHWISQKGQLLFHLIKWPRVDVSSPSIFNIFLSTALPRGTREAAGRAHARLARETCLHKHPCLFPHVHACPPDGSCQLSECPAHLARGFTNLSFPGPCSFTKALVPAYWDLHAFSDKHLFMSSNKVKGSP